MSENYNYNLEKYFGDWKWNIDQQNWPIVKQQENFTENLNSKYYMKLLSSYIIFGSVQNIKGFNSKF